VWRDRILTVTNAGFWATNAVNISLTISNADPVVLYVAVNSTTNLGVPLQLGGTPSSAGATQLAALVAPPPAVQITGFRMDGQNVVLSGSGGSGNGTYWVWSTTNLALPFGQWECVMTNTFNANGSFSNALPVTPGTPQMFYRLQVQ
jgi:hypothetical protein